MKLVGAYDSIKQGTHFYLQIDGARLKILFVGDDECSRNEHIDLRLKFLTRDMQPNNKGQGFCKLTQEHILMLNEVQALKART